MCRISNDICQLRANSIKPSGTILVGRDLSAPEQIPIRLLPIAMIATQFIMQKMTPTAGVDPAQQRMMMLMPLMMGFFFYGLSSGLVLYYLTANLVGIAQQWFFNKTMTPADIAPVAAKKRNSK